MRTLAGVAAVTAALACAASAGARTVVPTEQRQVLARGLVEPVGEDFVHDGFDDVLPGLE